MLPAGQCDQGKDRLRWWREETQMQSAGLDETSSLDEIWRILMIPLGEPHISKSDEFSEKFQTAFDPPPHFR